MIRWDGCGDGGNGSVNRDARMVNRFVFSDLTKHNPHYAGTETALNRRHPGRPGKSGTLSPTKRAGRGREHLSRYFGGRAGKPAGLNYVVAGSDGSFQQKLWGKRYPSETNSNENQRRVRACLL